MYQTKLLDRIPEIVICDVSNLYLFALWKFLRFSHGLVRWGMFQFAENEEIPRTYESRVGVTNEKRYGARRATLRRADWHARLDRLACSSTDQPVA